MTDTKSAEAQIKEAVWTYGGWFVLLSLTFGAGAALAYIFWGDAPRLRAENAELNQKVAGGARRTGERSNSADDDAGGGRRVANGSSRPHRPPRRNDGSPSPLARITDRSRRRSESPARQTAERAV